MKYRPISVTRLKFKAGRLYALKLLDRCGNWSRTAGGTVRRLRFIRDEAAHHIFRSESGGWLESFTDVQLADYQIKEAIA